MGYGLFEMQDPTLHFGKWNNRPINSTAKGALIHNMTKSANTRRYANAVPLVIHREDIDIATLVPIQGLSNVREVTWLKPLVTKECANGRHRHDAHKARMETVATELAKAEKHLAALSAAPNALENAVEIEAATKYRDGREVYLNTLRVWLGTFYDIGESCPAIQLERRAERGIQTS